MMFLKLFFNKHDHLVTTTCPMPPLAYIIPAKKRKLSCLKWHLIYNTSQKTEIVFFKVTCYLLYQQKTEIILLKETCYLLYQRKTEIMLFKVTCYSKRYNANTAHLNTTKKLSKPNFCWTWVLGQIKSV